MTRLTKKPKNCYQYLLRVWPCRSLIFIFRLRWTKWHFPQFKKCTSHRWTWFAAAPREFVMPEKTSVMLFKFPYIMGIKNRYFFFKQFNTDILLCRMYCGIAIWWSNRLETPISLLLFQVLQRYFLLSFSCCQGQNIWEIS